MDAPTGKPKMTYTPNQSLNFRRAKADYEKIGKDVATHFRRIGFDTEITTENFGGEVEITLSIRDSDDTYTPRFSFSYSFDLEIDAFIKHWDISMYGEGVVTHTKGYRSFPSVRTVIREIISLYPAYFKKPGEVSNRMSTHTSSEEIVYIYQRPYWYVNKAFIHEAERVSGVYIESSMSNYSIRTPKNDLYLDAHKRKQFPGHGFLWCLDAYPDRSKGGDQWLVDAVAKRVSELKLASDTAAKSPKIGLSEFKTLLACGDEGCTCGGSCGCKSAQYRFNAEAVNRALKARYEKGKSVDPTENMSEEDAAKWRENTEKYRDKFKTAGNAIPLYEQNRHIIEKGISKYAGEGEEDFDWTRTLISDEEAVRDVVLDFTEEVSAILSSEGVRFTDCITQVVDDVTAELDLNVEEIFKSDIRVRSMAEAAQILSYACFKCLDEDETILMSALKDDVFPVFKDVLHGGKCRGFRNAVESAFETLLENAVSLDPIEEDVDRMASDHFKGWKFDKVSSWNGVPEHLTKLSKVLQDVVFDYSDEEVRTFNSGYTGIVVPYPDGSTWLVIDQAGVVGSEDQTEGYIAFQKKGKTLTSGPVYYKHKSRGFGDVDVPESIRSRIYQQIVKEVQTAYHKSGKYASSRTEVVEFRTSRDLFEAVDFVEEELGNDIANLDWFLEEEENQIVLNNPSSPVTRSALKALSDSGIRQTRYQSRG